MRLLVRLASSSGLSARRTSKNSMEGPISDTGDVNRILMRYDARVR